MGYAYVFNDHLNYDDRTTIDSAVRAAGYDTIYSVPANVSSVNEVTDIGVVGLPVASEDAKTVEARIMAFAGAGVRVVGIWLRSEEDNGAGVPDGIIKYGITVDISSPELMRTLKGDVDVWQEPGGKSRPTPETKRNKC